MTTRHTCSYCGAKRYEEDMYLVAHRLVSKTAWVCRSHVSEFSDISILRPKREKPVFLELFSGSGHIAAAAGHAGFETITVDIEAKYNPDICLDICNLRRSALPGFVHVVWASIPCTVLSILSIPRHWQKVSIGYRRYWYTPKTAEARQTLRIIDATFRLLRRLKPTYFFIENPRGALRHLPHVAAISYRRCVYYSDYGFDYPKPTDIFTNNSHFRPVEATGPAQLTGKGVCDLNSAHERALVPPGLINEVIKSVRHLV